ncbi:MAG: hypothetical protein RO469_14445, partial [Thermincola sp.]|nr:hypothetical protein [Thermincola sp.]
MVISVTIFIRKYSLQTKNIAADKRRLTLIGESSAIYVGIEVRRAHLLNRSRFLKPPYNPGRSDFPSPV